MHQQLKSKFKNFRAKRKRASRINELGSQATKRKRDAPPENSDALRSLIEAVKFYEQEGTDGFDDRIKLYHSATQIPNIEEINENIPNIIKLRTVRLIIV